MLPKLKLYAIAAAVLVGPGLLAGPAAADFFGPKKKINCKLKKNKKKKACKKRSNLDIKTFNAAYWLAQTGKYAQAKALLAHADQDDPRTLNYTGFVTRKMGDVSGAMGYYQKALALNPDYAAARSYMGEALLQQGRYDAAVSQLDEIGKRCGEQCQEYANLSKHLADYRQAHGIE